MTIEDDESEIYWYRQYLNKAPSPILTEKLVTTMDNSVEIMQLLRSELEVNLFSTAAECELGIIAVAKRTVFDTFKDIANTFRTYALQEKRE